MKNKIFICNFCLFLACASQHQVVFRIGKSSITYRMKIPKGYEFKGLSSGLETEQKFLYPDSSVFYVTNFINSPNYPVMKLFTSDWALAESYRNKDTMNFSGVEISGKYCRERKLKYAAIGYRNADKKKASDFDQIIDMVIEYREQ